MASGSVSIDLPSATAWAMIASTLARSKLTSVALSGTRNMARLIADQRVSMATALAASAGVPCLAVVGEVVHPLPELPEGLTVVSLVERFGAERALADPCGCAVEAVLAQVSE